MGGVVDHPDTWLSHEQQRPEVDHEVAVPERRAALTEQDIGATAGSELFGDRRCVPRVEELSLLHHDGKAGGRRRQQEIGLATQEGGDLQVVDNLGDEQRAACSRGRQ